MIHIGLLVAWCGLHALLRGGTIEKLKQLECRALTPGEWLLDMLDGKLLRQDFNALAKGFADYYYPLEAPPYVRDYAETLCSNGEDWLALADSWDNFDRLGPVIDQRFAQWSDSDKARKLLGQAGQRARRAVGHPAG